MYELILTAYGLESLSDLEKVNLSGVVIGSGEIEPSLTTVSLKEPKAEVAISNIKKDPENSFTLQIEANIGVEIGGFTIKEIGILDSKNKLFAVGKFPPTYKPSVSESTSKAIKILFKLTTSNASKIELKVDNTKVYATNELLNEKTKELKVGINSTDKKLETLNDALKDKADKTEIPTDFYTKNASDEKFAFKDELAALQNALNEFENIRKGSVGNMILKLYPVKNENSLDYFTCDGAPILKEEYPELYEYSKNITSVNIKEDTYHFYFPEADNSLYEETKTFINHGRRNKNLSFKKSEIYSIEASPANIEQGQSIKQETAKKLFSFKLRDGTAVNGFPKGMNAWFKYAIDANKIGIWHTVLVLDYETEDPVEIPLKIEVKAPKDGEKPYSEAKITPEGLELMPKELIKE